MISFTIPGTIGGKGAVRHSGKRHWNSVRTNSDMELVRHFARQAVHGRKPIDGPVAIDIVVFRHTPPSWSKKKAEAAKWVTSRPDCSNIAKLVEDAINKLVFTDDARVARLSVSKEYANYMPEQVQVTVTELGVPLRLRAAA